MYPVNKVCTCNCVAGLTPGSLFTMLTSINASFVPLSFDPDGRLSLGTNHLSGTIPTEIGALTALQNLQLNNNLFQGQLPDTISALTQLWCGGTAMQNNLVQAAALVTVACACALFA